MIMGRGNRKDGGKTSRKKWINGGETETGNSEGRKDDGNTDGQRNDRNQ